MSDRLSRCFSRLRSQQQTAFIPFIMGGDPNYADSLAFLNALPAAGADIIEIGVPFSDPMADGPVIEAAGNRALDSGMTLSRVLKMVGEFREKHTETPVILMGYYNPIYRYGVEKFSHDAAQAGVDGLIIVDLPPEEEAEATGAFQANALDLIRLIAPTSDADRQQLITQHASGFVYYISVKGITGGASASEGELQQAISHLRNDSSLPIAIGFGIKTPEQAANAAKHGDAVVVGSAIVDCLHKQGHEAAIMLAKTLADAVHSPSEAAA